MIEKRTYLMKVKELPIIQRFVWELIKYECQNIKSLRQKHDSCCRFRFVTKALTSPYRTIVIKENEKHTALCRQLMSGRCLWFPMKAFDRHYEIFQTNANNNYTHIHIHSHTPVRTRQKYCDNRIQNQFEFRIKSKPSKSRVGVSVFVSVFVVFGRRDPVGLRRRALAHFLRPFVFESFGRCRCCCRRPRPRPPLVLLDDQHHHHANA